MARTVLPYGQGPLLVDVLSMTVLLLSILLACISVLRRSLDGSSAMRRKSSGLSVLRRWLDKTCDDLTVHKCQRPHHAVPVPAKVDTNCALKNAACLSGVPSPCVEEAITAQPRLERVVHAQGTSQQRQAMRISQAKVAVGLAKNEVLHEDVEEKSADGEVAKPGMQKSCSCSSEATWGCEHHRKYSSGVLLWHRELSVKIARGPPGLERPDIVASDRKIVPGLARRGVDF
eukprot:CAMPEP_0170604190 /NCGR_PEP_ID=MMETSP0224-20130122/19293_1 /TAXON_ID=285029 /ORGANISM="Togula jolla, Strain CCCM 725" /LENGTH=230 /DNA_ID=CAMNT_0010929081 /DNA_START=47 /DNA_END=739 /DNA_ORIENTATION=-